MANTPKSITDVLWHQYSCPDCKTITEHLDMEEPFCTKCALEAASVQVCIDCGDAAQTFVDGVCNTCLSQKDDEDNIDWPKHYNTGKIQPIDAIEDWKLDFRLANAVKYIARCEHKGNTKNDLEKALWYVQRYIDKELGDK